MSDNWNKNQLHKRLNSIFSDLDQPIEIPGLSIFNQVNGWIWEINPAALITKCSPDIAHFLGYQQQELINTPLSDIAEFNLETINLPTDRDSQVTPERFEITFIDIEGESQPAICYIIPRFNDTDEFVGWRGVTISESAPPSPEDSSDMILGISDNDLMLEDFFSPEDILAPVPDDLLSDSGRSNVLELEDSDEFDDSIYFTAEPTISPAVQEFLKDIDDDPDREWEAEELQLVQQVYTQLELAIENATLFQQTQQALAETDEQARKLQQLNLLGEYLSQSNTFEEALSYALQQLDKVINAQLCLAALPDFENQLFTIYHLKDNNLQTTQQTFLFQESFLGWIMDEKKIHSKFSLQNSNFPDAEALAEQHKIQSLIAGPMIADEDFFGILLAGTSIPEGYTTQDENMMQSVSSLVASTIKNRQLLQQIQRRSVQLETSAEVSRTASTILDPNELLPRVVNLIKEGFGLYYVGIFLIDHQGDWTQEPGNWAVLRAGTGDAGQKMLEANHKLEIGGESMIGTSIASAEAKIALNVGSEVHFFRNPYLPDTKSEMALPLISRGRVLGALTIQSEHEAAFTNEDITSLQTLADQLANAIENASLFEQTQARAKELSVLNEMATAFTQTMDVDLLIEHTYNFTSRLMDASNFYLALYNAEDVSIEFKLFTEDGERIPPPEPKIILGDGLTDWIVINKLPILLSDNLEEHLAQLGIEVRGQPALSWLGVPMLLGEKVIGVIAVQSYTHANSYRQQELDLLISIASQAAVAIDSATRFQRSQAQARYEQILREITTRVHSSTNTEAVLKTAAREIGAALGRQTHIELKTEAEPNFEDRFHAQAQSAEDEDQITNNDQPELDND